MDPRSELAEKIAQAATPIGSLQGEIAKQLKGQHHVVEGLLVALLTGGHVLLDGHPGLGKTLAVRTLAEALTLDFARVQFTPDLLPADLVGTQIYRQDTHTFEAHRGPIFAHIVLADEINRAPAKVQSALLEAMEEGQVTLGRETLRLPDPFFVLATRNPGEPQGTYLLPDSQVDRFLLNIVMDYPSRDEEAQMLAERMGAPQPPTEPTMSRERLAECRTLCAQVHLDESLQSYILDIVGATRSQTPHEDLAPTTALIERGASPRATLSLARAAQAQAFLDRRAWVIPDDIKAAAPDVLRHRIRMTFEAEADDRKADELIDEILNRVPVP